MKFNVEGKTTPELLRGYKFLGELQLLAGLQIGYIIGLYVIGHHSVNSGAIALFVATAIIIAFVLWFRRAAIVPIDIEIVRRINKS